MSADRQALLQALREEPDDERLRLIYADWLEDHGDPDRAEFIRLCHELSGLDENDPHAQQLEGRRKQLFSKHKKRWGPGLPAAVSGSLARRGLVQHVESTAAAFLKCGDALHGEPVARVTLTHAAKHIKQLLDSPALTGVRELAVRDSRLNDAAVKALAGSPRLVGLRTLRLAACDITSGRAVILAGSPHLAGLRTLDLGHYHRHDEDVNNTPHRTVGITVAISGGSTNHLDDDGFAALADSPHLMNLETLIVANNWIRLDGFRRLWANDRHKHLRRLDLSFNYLGPEGLRELVSSPLMKRLTALEIHGNEVGPEGVRSLAASSNVRQLRLLDVSGTTVYDDRPRLNNAAAEALAGSKHLAGLEHLILTFTEIGPKGAAALAKSANLKSLRSLYLGNGQLGSRGAQAFASSGLLGRLTHLDLSANGLLNVGAMAFVRSKKAGPQLTLDLTGNEFDRQSVEALRGRFGQRVRVPDAGEDDEDDMEYE